MRPSSTKKSGLLMTKNRHPYGAKSKVSFAADFEVIVGRNRLSF